MTNPWRFRLLGPETRAQIDELVPEAEVMKLRRAPTLVLVTAVRSEDPVLAEEDVRATAAATYAMLLGATERGLASYWRTPSCFGEPSIRELLGLAENEVVVALVHLGPPVTDATGERARAGRGRIQRTAVSAGERIRTSTDRSPPGPKPGA